MSRQTFFRAGRVEDIIARGWLKATIFGRRVFVMNIDDELVAWDGGGIGTLPCESPIPAEFYGIGSMLLDSCCGSDGRQWDKMARYPVRIEGDNILVGSQSYF